MARTHVTRNPASNRKPELAIYASVAAILEIMSAFENCVRKFAVGKTQMCAIDLRCAHASDTRTNTNTHTHTRTHTDTETETHTFNIALRGCWNASKFSFFGYRLV